MNVSEQTLHQIERALRKTTEKCGSDSGEPRLTDLYILVKQDSGEIRVLDDDDNEITRCVVEEWIDNTSEDFYTDIQPLLQTCIHKLREPIEAMHLLRPFSFVLVDEEHTNIAELYLVDDDTLIIDHNLMEDSPKISMNSGISSRQNDAPLPLSHRVIFTTPHVQHHF